jgi:endoglucanase
MKVLKAGFNMNWFEFEFLSSLNIASYESNTITIFPNPVLEKIYIKLNNQQIINNLKIIDVNGRIVKKIKPSVFGGFYNLSNLKPGIYILILETNEGRYQKKLIKK